MAFYVNDLELVEDDISYGDLEEVTHVTFEKPTYDHIKNFKSKFPVDQINIAPQVAGGIVIWLTVHYEGDDEPTQIDFSRYYFLRGCPSLIKEY